MAPQDSEQDGALRRQGSQGSADGLRRSNSTVSESAAKRPALSDHLKEKMEEKEAHDDHGHHKKGTLSGVFIPTCENMWGVLIFLRFYFIVGHAGVGQALAAVCLSFMAAFCTVTSMCAILSSGGKVSEGGPYYMMSRTLGPSLGVSIGMMYWLAFTFLAVLETLGAVETLFMAKPAWDFAGAVQIYGTGLLIGMCIIVWAGVSFVTKMGIVFAMVVFFTITSYFVGLFTAPAVQMAQDNYMVTGISESTLQDNMSAHYRDGVSFGTVLSVFFPCFTGILSGANRSDVLQDPVKNIRTGTFGAIIFSLFMYSTFMILWGSVAEWPYLQGDGHAHMEAGGRRLGGGGKGGYIVEEIVWNPFQYCAHIGIIISSISQALQCLVCAPRLLQKMAGDQILKQLRPVAALSKSGEPNRALFATYLAANSLCLIGSLDAVAPLLTCCFLIAYTTMNFSCFCLTCLMTPSWRPAGIQEPHWRCWYLCVSLLGFLICLTIMFTVNVVSALIIIILAAALNVYTNWQLQAKQWGSAMDGIKFDLALRTVLSLKDSQSQSVNWRPHVLVLHKVHMEDEAQGIKHHEILKLAQQFKKGQGMSMVAAVLEGDQQDVLMMEKARSEKQAIEKIMEEECIDGFAEVVVAPTWGEGSNYIIQLTGIGGLTPNTILVGWPTNWRKQPHKAMDFANILSCGLAEEKALLAAKDLKKFPDKPVYGTIDIWWMIHDGGFLILLGWLLLQHPVWKDCRMRIFTVMEGVTVEEATKAATALTSTLKAKKLFDVEVEVILADSEMMEPFTFDWLQREEERSTNCAFMDAVNDAVNKESGQSNFDPQNAENRKAFKRLNGEILSRSKRAELVMTNMPNLWSLEQEAVEKWADYCDTLTQGLDRVLFVHSSGHEIADITV